MGNKWMIVVFMFVLILKFGQNCNKNQRCRISRMYGMKGADCYNKDYRTFPQCIISDIEIIDLMHNRIRMLSSKDLERYTSLKMLYLSDNLIGTIDANVFHTMDNLNTLDLSLNGLTKISPAVFQMPSLKTLYLGQNMNINIVEAIEGAKPISSPLTHLDLSLINTDTAGPLPEFGMMPHLLKLNVSGNKYDDLHPRHFAGLCSLQIFDNTNVTIEFDNGCECWIINHWLQERKVHFTPFVCEVDENSCFDTLEPSDLEIFKNCQKQVEIILKKAKFYKFGLPIFGILLVCFLSFLYVFIKRKKNKTSMENIKQKPMSIEDQRPFL